MELRWIPHLSPAYALAVALRREVLRRPLGLEYTEAQLAAEASSLHLACFDGEVMAGTLLLTPVGTGSMQMRQVAVEVRRRGSGIGARLVEEAEAETRRRGRELLFLHARESALGFYEKLGYACVGDPFEEVGLPHRAMEKVLLRT